ncbi:glycine oxidase-like isoform X1 [Panicum virgatum]|uniref:glycine oxidase-like isoform X1 n=1 Tax=Panicum virgatum TaxID=38727 RepID=UPI0019D6805C|nr:glycine oxidase-like isoform X1 [Panicum virgatum]
MDAAIAFTSARNPSPTRFSSSSSPASPSSHFPQRLCVCSPWRGRERRLRALRPQSQIQAPGATSADTSNHDVVVVGAGIVGLTIARHLLLHTPLSVAVADAAVPCSGATGAGQGYIWMSHRMPGSDMWELAARSKQLWEELAAEVDGQGGGGAREKLGWMRTALKCSKWEKRLGARRGSGGLVISSTYAEGFTFRKQRRLLVGRTSEELATLEERTKVLSEAGIHAEFLSASSLHALEPALSVEKDGGAMFLPQDCQIDAFQAVSLIEKTNNSYSSEGRYMEIYNDPAMSLIRSEVTGTVEAVQTSRNILYGRKAIVIASGAWTRSLLHSFLEPALTLDIPVKPRKGHLLVVENFDKVKLNHALMEVGYVDHQVAKSNHTHMASESSEDEHGALSISMTATVDAKGNLVLGSSREFKGFSREVDKSVVKCIWERAGEFFPAMKNVPLDIDHNTQIRIGHRPYMPDGKPVIGFIPDLPNVLIATGHEGNGLTMALGTAEMVTDMILGNPGKVDCSPFSIKHRFSG